MSQTQRYTATETEIKAREVNAFGMYTTDENLSN